MDSWINIERHKNCRCFLSVIHQKWLYSNKKYNRVYYPVGHQHFFDESAVIISDDTAKAFINPDDFTD